MTANKTVTILARYFVKATQTVIYSVRNGEDRQYTVGLHKSGHTTCTCKHGENAGNHAHCYHVTNCQAAETARQTVEVAPVVAAVSTKAERESATLNGRNRPFSFMR